MSAPLEDADVETASAGYALRFASPVGRWMLERQLTSTLDLLQDLGPSSLLDVGGGHGQVAPELARRGHRVTVLASSPAAVSTSLRHAIASGTVSLLTGSLREPPVAPRSFDVVLSYRLLAHAHDLDGLVKGLAGAARRAVIADYATSRSFNAIADLFFAAKKGVEKNTRPFWVIRDADLIRRFEANGCRPGARRPQFFWPMALHRALRSVWIARVLEAPASATGILSTLGSPVIARFDRV